MVARTILEFKCLPQPTQSVEQVRTLEAQGYGVGGFRLSKH